MIKDWLAEYKPKNKEEAVAALREIMQEVALAGLCRAGFFESAAFYGGTALRIFHGLDRFSEDMDFSLIQPEEDFALERYLESIQVEFQALGMKVSVREKKKTKISRVESAFLKSETIWKDLVLESIVPQNGLMQSPEIKIKLEVDTSPPVGFETEEGLLLRPFSFYVKCFTLPYLFAGKMHALLFRKWKENVKGRDWYDFEWYVRKGIPVNIEHFLARARNSADLHGELSEEQFRKLLSEKIETVNMDRVKSDAARFIPDSARIEIWSRKYFSDLARHLKITGAQ